MYGYISACFGVRVMDINNTTMTCVSHLIKENAKVQLEVNINKDFFPHPIWFPYTDPLCYVKDPT